MTAREFPCIKCGRDMGYYGYLAATDGACRPCTTGSGSRSTGNSSLDARLRRNARARARRAAMKDAMESIGMTRVRVNGRVSWE
jgi:hypothetical protein